MDHSSPIAILKFNGKAYLNFYSEECVASITRGDSIVKKRDSVWIAVYRHRVEVGKFYPECDGRKILSATTITEQKVQQRQ